MTLSRTVYLGAVALVTAATMVVSSPSQAVAAPDPDGHYAAFTLVGGDDLEAHVGFPFTPGAPTVATIASDKKLFLETSGTNSTLPNTRGFGQVFGSSSGKDYLRIGSSRVLSTVTIDFFAEYAPGRVGIAIGDIDAEVVVVSMKNAAGADLAGSQMGAQTPFNYGSSSALPRQTIGASSVTLDDPDCPADGEGGTCNTTGATGWFIPTAAVKTITITATSKTVSAQYQLWLAKGTTQIVTWAPGTTELSLADDLPHTPSPLAESSGDGAITYSVDTTASSSDCTVHPTTAVIAATKAGTCAITATAAKDGADLQGSTTVVFTITAPSPPPPPSPEPTKPPTPTEWNPETTTFQVDSFPGVIDLPPPPNPPGGGSYTFTTHGDSTSLCTVDRDTPTVTVQQPGTCIVTANVGATKNFSKASVTVAFTIASGPMLAATGAPAWPVWPAVAGLVGAAMLVASRVLYSPRHRDTSA